MNTSPNSSTSTLYFTTWFNPFCNIGKQLLYCPTRLLIAGLFMPSFFNFFPYYTIWVHCITLITLSPITVFVTFKMRCPQLHLIPLELCLWDKGRPELHFSVADIFILS